MSSFIVAFCSLGWVVWLFLAEYYPWCMSIDRQHAAGLFRVQLNHTWSLYDTAPIRFPACQYDSILLVLLLTWNQICAILLSFALFTKALMDHQKQTQMPRGITELIVFCPIFMILLSIVTICVWSFRCQTEF